MMNKATPHIVIVAANSQGKDTGIYVPLPFSWPGVKPRMPRSIERRSEAIAKIELAACPHCGRSDVCTASQHTGNS
jgi:hypothetical protein